jgi:DegV family protein with EDD domain
MAVQVITDSTSDIPQQIAAKLGVFIVPIFVSFGDRSYRDGVDIRSETFYKMLATLPDHPSTSQPNPENFTAAYKKYCDNADGIVSIHISSKISGTYNSANTARKTLESRCPIEVIDSKFNSAGLGLVVLAAARLAQSGAGLSEVVNEAHTAISQVRMYGMFETMKYLALSGRVSKTIATASRILSVMPLLTFHDGEIIRAGLVRTIKKGMEHIYNYVRNNIPASELTIVHSAVNDRANELKRQLTELVPEEKISIAELGAGLGVHGGPGVLLVALRKSANKGK